MSMEACNYDYVIVGAGPAGLQMAYFLQKAQRRYVVLEATDRAANFFINQPRHRKMISINKRFNKFKEDSFNLRHDWNSLLSDDPDMRFTKYSDELYPNANDLVKYMNDFAEHFKLNIKYSTRVTKISKPAGVFNVTTQDGQRITSKCVFMATGATEENLPDSTEGIELADTYANHDIDKERYKDKVVLVIGGGNSAFEVANYLSDCASIVHVAFNKRIQFAWDTHYVGDLRAVNNQIIDMYHLKSLHSTIASNVVKVEATPEGKLVATFRDLNTHWDTPGWLYFKIEYDHVISCCGWKYVKPDIFDDTIEIETTKGGRYPMLSNTWETKTENLFYIGAPMGAIDRQSASGFIHGFRYNIRSLFNILEDRFFKVSLPQDNLSCCLQTIADKVLERASVADGIYQMNGFLCDVMVVNQDGARYYTELPRKHVTERPEFTSAQHVFVIHMSYGFDKFPESSKPVDNVHAPDFSTNRCASFMHPYIEYYNYGAYVDQTELHESLIVRYDSWTCANMPQWTMRTNINYIKHYVNEKMHWTDERFNLVPLPKEIAEQIFVPLTPEERSRIPAEWEPSQCKPSRELMPLVSNKTTRVLKPAPTDIVKSMGFLAETNGNKPLVIEPRVALQTH